MMQVRQSYGFICEQESISAVQRRPEPYEQVVIDEYCQR